MGCAPRVDDMGVYERSAVPEIFRRCVCIFLFFFYLGVRGFFVGKCFGLRVYTYITKMDGRGMRNAMQARWNTRKFGRNAVRESYSAYSRNDEMVLECYE